MTDNQPGSPPGTSGVITMERYMVESVEFASDFSQVIITYVDLPLKGPVIDRVQRCINLTGEPDLQQQIWDAVDTLCDVLDEAWRIKVK